MDNTVLNKYGSLAFRNVGVKEILLPELQKYLCKSQMDTSFDLIHDESYIEKIINFLRLNEESFACFSQLTDGDFKFFFSIPQSCERILQNFSTNLVSMILSDLNELKDLNLMELKKIANKYGLTHSKIMHLMRLTLIDNQSGPPIKELFDFFGNELCHERIKKMISLIKNV